MKKLFIIGNWKSYKTAAETREWFLEISNFKFQISNEKEIILCVPFTVLSLAKSLVEQYDVPIRLGAQDISPFDEGKYTGEVNGKQIAEFAEYVVIGHSERRQYFSEDDEMLAKKVAMAVKYDLQPIYCIAGKETDIPDGIDIIVYEPISAIGTGNPETPENAEDVCAFIKEQYHTPFTLYGGSVTSQNVHGFTSLPSISGVLPGGASLIAEEFAAIITNA